MSSEEVAARQARAGRLPGAARRLGVEPARCAAIEDSHSGIRSANAAGLRVIAIPNPSFPPEAEALAGDAVLHSLEELTPDVVDPSLEP